MARPTKTNLGYFPFDCDFFEDEKVVAIAGEFGMKGEMCAIRLLCAIYRNGYYIEWTDMLQVKLMRSMPGVSLELLNQIVTRLVKWGFFDPNLFSTAKVLTSRGIQSRYLAAKRYKCDVREMPFWIVNVAETPVIDTKTPIIDAETPIKESKRKKIKESKIEKSADAPHTPSEVLNDFSLEGVIALMQLPDVAKLNPTIRDAEKFYAHYAARGWQISRGVTMVSVKDGFISWLNRRLSFPNDVKEMERQNKQRKRDERERQRQQEAQTTGEILKGDKLAAFLANLQSNSS